MSAFLNALREGGTREDMLAQLERLMDERTALRAAMREARAALIKDSLSRPERIDEALAVLYRGLSI